MEKLALDDGSLLARALNNVRKWEENGACHRQYVQHWRDLLAMPLSDARERVLAQTEEAAALRQNNPFAGFFSEIERQALRRAAIE